MCWKTKIAEQMRITLVYIRGRYGHSERPEEKASRVALEGLLCLCARVR